MNLIESKRKSKKSIKQIDENLDNLSIDILHARKIKYFEDLQNIVLPEKQKELEILKKNKIIKGVIELETEIKNILNRSEENEYYLDNLHVLYKYTQYNDTIKDTSNVKVFGKKNVKTVDSKKNDLYNDYLHNNDIRSYYTTNSSLSLNCSNCGEFDSMIKNEGFHLCNKCGITQDNVIFETITFKDKDHTCTIDSIDYQRINYFKENLFQIQGKELKEIPQIIIDEIINELSKERFTDLSKLNLEKVKLILKKINRSTWYEHASMIMSKVTGKQAIKIPIDVQEKMFYMFNIIETYFKKYKFRPHFFSYPYIIHKLFELLGLKEYYDYFPYLRDRNKLHEQDVMLKKVITDVIKDKHMYTRFPDIEWKFIPST